MLGRLSYATVGLALILQVQRATGSYSCAGAAAVAYGWTAALLAPLRGRLVDRWGRRRALPPIAGSTALLLTVIALLGQHLGGSAPALVVLSGLVGCGLPPLGPVTRGVWADSAGSEVELRAAYSLDTVAEEGLFTAGPLLVGVVVALADARSALLLTAVLMLVGTGAMVRSPLTGGPAAAADDAPVAAPAPAPSLLRRPAFVSLLLVLFGVGAGLGGVELAAIAVARSSGAAGTGAVLAALNLGSAAGGLAYGARAWRSDTATHLVVLSALLAAGIGDWPRCPGTRRCRCSAVARSWSAGASRRC